MHTIPVQLKSALRKVPGYRWAQLLYRLAKGVESRNAALILLSPPKGLFQPYGTTSADRYPLIFECVQSHLGRGRPCRILSFGCSTGEEVFSLRPYFTVSQIVGIDINRHNIARCKARLRKMQDPEIRFVCGGSTAGEESDSLDVIFAMAVFRHGNLNLPLPPLYCGAWIRFEEFEACVADFARCLKRGGLLVIQNAMFRFEDTAVFHLFAPEPCAEVQTEGPFYGRNNSLLPPSCRSAVIFRKLEDLITH